MATSDGDDGHDCPTCGRRFSSERGVKVHHTMAHGESIAGVTVECSHCGDETAVQRSRLDYYDKHYCDDECQFADDDKVNVDCDWCGDTIRLPPYRLEQSDHHFCRGTNCFGNWQSVARSGGRFGGLNLDELRDVQCANCGVDIEDMTPARALQSANSFCSPDCHDEWRRTSGPRGEEHPAYSRIEVDCDWCGEPLHRTPYFIDLCDHHFCRGADCYANWRRTIRGPDHHLWEGGRNAYVAVRSSLSRPWSVAKEKSRERDGYACQFCGEPESGRAHHVHHIVPVRYGGCNAAPLLTTLCAGCHRTVEKSTKNIPEIEPVLVDWDDEELPDGRMASEEYLSECGNSPTQSTIGSFAD